MATSSITFNPEELIGKINELEKVLLPRAATNALHKAVFETTKELSSEAKNRFTNPVPFTLKSFLYKKPVAVGNNSIEASVFIRDDAAKGNPPAKYLQGVMGGQPNIYPTRFQRMLRRLPDRSRNPNRDALGNQGHILGAGEVMAPNLGSPKVRTNQYRNMTVGQYTEILTDLAGGASSADYLTFRSEKQRMKRKAQNERRAAKGKKPLKRDSGYFYMNPNSPQIAGGKAGPGTRNKSGGIFFRTAAGKLHRIMTQTSNAHVPFKFDFLAIAEDSVGDIFEAELIKNLKR